MFHIKKISGLQPSDLTTATTLLQQESTHPIACNNWASQFPYSPEVKFSIAHNEKELFIRFDVAEKYTMAKVTEDNGEVWTDSCVEFFIAFDDSGYYNFEFTCIGKALLGFRKERPNAVHATPDIMQSIKRLSTLGTANFDEKTGNNNWTLTVAIPATAFFKHRIGNLENVKAKANIYKCGDNLSEPHFLSWQPINMPTPNFHVPQFFTEIEFQK